MHLSTKANFELPSSEVTLISRVTLICTRKQLQMAKSVVDIKSRHTLSYMWLLGHVIKLLGHVITIFIAKILRGANSAFRMWRLATPMQMQINST